MINMWSESPFYSEWTKKRLALITKRLGKSWFPGKRILELGCGSGIIGCALAELGANVTCSDARQEFLTSIDDRITKKYAPPKTVLADLNYEWPFDCYYDLVLNFGLLYHLHNPRSNLILSIKSGDILVVETKVYGRSSEVTLIEEIARFDSAVDLIGSNFGSELVVEILDVHANSYEEIDADLSVGDDISYPHKRKLWWVT